MAISVFINLHTTSKPLFHPANVVKLPSMGCNHLDISNSHRHHDSTPMKTSSTWKLQRVVGSRGCEETPVDDDCVPLLVFSSIIAANELLAIASVPPSVFIPCFTIVLQVGCHFLSCLPTLINSTSF